jgi:hypothetical protein
MLDGVQRKDLSYSSGWNRAALLGGILCSFIGTREQFTMHCYMRIYSTFLDKASHERLMNILRWKAHMSVGTQ